MIRTACSLGLLAILTALPMQGNAQSTHTVVEGESLIHISQQYNVCVEEIVDANPHFQGVLYDIFHLYTGESVRIPTNAPPCYADDMTTFEYTVAEGDTMFGLSAFYRVPIVSIGRTGEFVEQTDPTFLEVGEVLIVPVNGQTRTFERLTQDNSVTFEYSFTSRSTYLMPDAVARNCNTTTESVLRQNGFAVGDQPPTFTMLATECHQTRTVHESEVPSHPTLAGEVVVVAPNQTLLSIALEHNIHPDALAELNGVGRPHYLLSSGSLLFVPTEPVAPPPRDTSQTEYVVRWGDTLTDIARAYRSHPTLIATENDLRNPDQLYPGQVLRVPRFIQGIVLLQWGAVVVLGLLAAISLGSVFRRELATPSP